MSTRCNVVIKNQNGDTHVMYHHWDGYPSGVGRELEKLFKYCNESVLASVDECAKFVNDISPSYEMDMVIAPDIDYLYTIDIDNKTIKCESISHSNGKALVYLANFGDEVASQY